ncbi:protein KRI1 homolog [Trichogramma pretiosum]|uniref:protein KRI1 homolog n=1 Tax=Trichogramma pretiosum TaxID=7493 RepID=UPI0006C97A5D|nr:protein KRI1 homolog [Trichogramma pretiosum]
MPKLFDDQDSSGAEEELKINEEYAKNYDNWRKKEELQKLKASGDNVNLDDNSDESTSSSEDDDDDEEIISKELDKDFFKTLACLKNRDPRIYDRNVKFFKDHEESEQAVDKSKKTNKKEKPMNLREYNNKLLVEKEGKLSDSEDEDKEKKKNENVPYVQQIATIQESIGKALQEIDENDDGDEIIKQKINTEEDIKEEDHDIIDFLKGKEININEEEKKDFEPLRNYWNNSNLDKSEQFLRDYILNKKFLGRNDDNDQKNDFDAHLNLSEDEKDLIKQEEFEHKYNFRFEEPDQEFLKRYPRVLENSMRKKDTRRADKRAELKKRKEEEKMQKREKLKELKVLKRKEIEERLEKLKEITGNDDIQLNMVDLEEDFDPDAYDKKMRQVFNDDYYAAAENEDVKPEFPEIDEELCIEPNWDNYDPQNDEIDEESAPHNNEPHCEDPDFNMDAEYDGTQNLQDKIIESTKTKKRRRRSKFSELIAKEKPKFDPSQHSSYKEYYDQYYALDYEDIIGDIPCRFKYREVVPNDYGLTLEEILAADEKELNRWCSLKKALQYKPEHVEKNDVKLYQEKAKNEYLKRKILKSLYKEPEEEADEILAPGTSNNKEIHNSTKKSEKEIKKSKESSDSIDTNNEKQQKSKKKRKRESINSQIKTEESSGTNTVSVEEQTNSSKKFKIESKTHSKEEEKTSNSNTANNKIQASSKITDQDGNSFMSKKELRKQKYKQLNKKFNKKEQAEGDLHSLSEERLKAYGLNPKKFKNKMKYMKKKL